MIYTYSEPWPDWRSGDHDQLRAWLNRPSEGMLFDVEHNNFWHGSWGERPEKKASATAIASRMLARVPTMVPIYGHRYLPSGTGSSGHPVLSMWQTDIIYYGTNLADYIDASSAAATSAKSRGIRAQASTSGETWFDLTDQGTEVKR